MLKRILVAMFAMSAMSLAPAADKAVVYNHIATQATPLDATVHDVLSKQYKVVDVRGNDQGYVKPVPRGGGTPATPKLPGGGRLTGHVTIVYVVTAEGAAIAPHVVSTTDPRLNKVAMGAMKRWKFQPASLAGKPVAVAAAQEFHFH